MIQLRGADDDKEVVEMAPNTKCQLIDGLHYVETKQVQRIGVVTTLQELRAFEMVVVDTGFGDETQPRVMTILPKKRHGMASLLASLVVAACSIGCTGTTYHYSYTCYGQGCAPPVTFGYTQRAMPQQARVMYVDRPVEVRVRRDGTIDTRDFQRRAAQPRRRAQ